MAYQSLYRKWRPKTFDDVVGQDHITETLKNEILTGKTAHAYLFCGTRGTGKTSCARILAKAVNCPTPKGANPCGECDICTGIDAGSVLDVIEIDAASNNGVDNIREIRDEVIYHPSQGKYKVYIIDEVHMLSTGAFNALLKTLEEPPEHVIFILATTESHKLPVTITSRCQRFDFRRITVSDIVKRLKEVCYNESVKADDEALELIANLADGALRDALSILDRCQSACDGDITLEGAEAVLGIAPDKMLGDCINCIASKDASGILSVFDDVISNGRDLTNFIGSVMQRFRDIMVYKTVKSPEKLFECSREALRSIKSQSEVFSNAALSYILRTLNSALNDAKFSKSPRIMYELAMFKLCDETIDSDADALSRRVEALEEKLRGNAFTPAPTPVIADNTASHSVPSKDEALPWDEDKPVKKAPEPIKEEPITPPPPPSAEIKPQAKSGDWTAVLDYMKKNSPALFGMLSVKKAIIFEDKLYLPDEAYLKAILSTMESTLRDSCMAVLGFIPKTDYVSEAQIDAIVQKRAAANGAGAPVVKAEPAHVPEPVSAPDFAVNNVSDFTDDFEDAPPPAPIVFDEGYNLEEDDADDEDDADPLDTLFDLSDDIHIE